MKECLLVMVYEIDDEVFDIWNKKVGIFVDCIICIGDKKGGKKFDLDNFW